MQLRKGWFTGLLLVGSCSLALDPEQTQCSEAAHCGVYDGKPIYDCVESYCEPVRCTSDTECGMRGSFICENNACAPAQCLQDAACTEAGQTCAQGRCVDPVFGCFNQKMPLMSETPASIEVRVLDYATQDPITSFSVRVCGAADLACNSPLNVPTVYDDKGLLRVTGLENGKRYSLRFSGTNGLGYAMMDAEYFMQRPVVGRTVEADKLEMFPANFASVAGFTAEVPLNLKEGLVLAQVFGCDNKPLAGVSLADTRNASPFYLDGTPNPNATETDNSGVGGFCNMEVGASGVPIQHKLSFSYGSSSMFAFTVTPRPNVVTFVQVYLGDYGTTSDRSDSAPIRR